MNMLKNAVPSTQKEYSMPRPRKEGNALPENLYRDNKGRPDYYRYKNQDGRFKTIIGEYEKVCAIAEEANRLRGETNLNTSRVGGFSHWLPKYIEWKEAQNPAILKKRSWATRKNLLKGFCQEFDHIRPSAAQLSDFEAWWEALTYDQQHNRRSELSFYFQWLLGKGVVKLNPFTTADNSPRLFEKAKPARKRMRLDIKGFWGIYDKAGELGLDYVQIGMGVSLLTSMREGDICSLKLKENIINNRLCKTIQKSEQQRGESAASHLSWHLNQHAQLKKLIARARKLALQNLACPYILSFMPKVRRRGKTKDHYCQVTPRMLISGFDKAREAYKKYSNLPKGVTPPTFHEIRGLCLKVGEDNHLDLKDLCELAAHSDVKVTKSYLAGHKPVFKEMGIVFDSKMIGGSFGK